MAAVAPTVALVPAAADEVSAVGAFVPGTPEDYHALTGRAAARPSRSATHETACGLGSRALRPPTLRRWRGGSDGCFLTCRASSRQRWAAAPSPPP